MRYLKFALFKCSSKVVHATMLHIKTYQDFGISLDATNFVVGSFSNSLASLHHFFF